ncbi:nucleotidyltransferase family protein [Sabulicella glaciei]|uniref:Sugar phosphate nucleotidyltransferase n=1 Tax=Sabulicella glaciei TaxID=2984948 RepID=A0ABT3NZE5_9PROT|nr:sugar phosphate nucleotidyltransferase [Roseococcus sp. MDT2-1-1]MCW8087508.1 sugar phosphate nucleotidyltransferase [Roseococcus sp. MDT2-1-1]
MKAVIMAGGRGTRLGPYTALFPKPLVPLGEGMPVLELLLRQLRSAGVEEVILAVNHLHHLLRAFFGDGERIGLRIRYSLEDKPLGTAGPLGAVLDEVGDTFFVTNGDLLTTLDFKSMLQEHEQTGAAATVASFRREVKIDFGLLETDPKMRMTGYIEKPSYPHLVSMGCYVLQREAVRNHVQPGAYLDMPDLMRALVRDDHHVHCHAPDCRWLDIGRPDDYATAQELFQNSRNIFLSDEG